MSPMTASPIAFDLELADYTHRDHTAYSTEGLGFDAHKPTLRIVGNRGVQQGIIYRSGHLINLPVVGKS